MHRASLPKEQPERSEGYGTKPRVRRVLEHYESQSDEEAVAEDKAAYDRVPSKSGFDLLGWRNPQLTP